MSQQEIHSENAARPAMSQDAAEEARKEREAIRWCESMGRKLNDKRTDYQPKRRRRVDRR